MNRKEIKEEAKKKIQGNKWDILWPLLVISVITSLLGRLFGANVTINFTNFDATVSTTQMTPMATVGSILVPIVGSMFADFLNSLIITMFINIV